MTRLFVLTLLMLLVSAGGLAADRTAQVVIYDGKPTALPGAQVTQKGLWITISDLALATGFHIKPQGVCKDELCFPIPAKRKGEFISKRGSTTWFNVTEFAALIKQPVARDEKNGVWYFGPRVESHEGYRQSLKAPDFTLPDQNGKRHSLSEFLGKKVLLVTWASW